MQTISGTVTDAAATPGAIVTLYDNGVLIGTTTVDANGSWSTIVTLSGNGTHSIVATDTDAAGNTGTSSPVVFTLNKDEAKGYLSTPKGGASPASASPAAAAPAAPSGTN